MNILEDYELLIDVKESLLKDYHEVINELEQLAIEKERIQESIDEIDEEIKECTQKIIVEELTQNSVLFKDVLSLVLSHKEQKQHAVLKPVRIDKKEKDTDKINTLALEDIHKKEKDNNHNKLVHEDTNKKEEDNHEDKTVITQDQALIHFKSKEKEDPNDALKKDDYYWFEIKDGSSYFASNHSFSENFKHLIYVLLSNHIYKDKLVAFYKKNPTPKYFLGKNKGKYTYEFPKKPMAEKTNVPQYFKVEDHEVKVIYQPKREAALKNIKRLEEVLGITIENNYGKKTG